MVFAIDNRYVAPLGVTLESFCETNKAHEYHVTVLFSELSKKNRQSLKRHFETKSLEVSFHKIDDCFKKYDVGYHFNSVIFYRLLAYRLFSDQDQFLYCDADALFLGDISELFDLEMGGYALGAVCLRGYNNEERVPEHMTRWVGKYFPSFLMLIDANKYSSLGVLERCMYFLDNETWKMPDQDALNYAVGEDFFELPSKYVVYKHIIDYVDDPLIFQFTGSSKPWLP